MNARARGIRALAAGVLVGAGFLTGATANATGRAPVSHPVGVLTETLVDTHRSTPASGTNPMRPDRTLVTTIWYPAQGNAQAGTARHGATPDRRGGPYPLIVFGHGLGVTPQTYEQVITDLAAAGYVVAAPRFPLSSGPGGTDAADTGNQPADVSYVITAMLKASTRNTGTLAGLVDPHAVGVTGHSNGAITTLGVAANTCCHDSRVKAAVVLSGLPEVFPGGHYDYHHAPPLLLVHGTDDALLPYSQIVEVFNRAQGPKGLLTLEGGDHGGWITTSNRYYPSAFRATIDFFAAFLRGDKSARKRIAGDQQNGATTMHFVAKTGATATIPTVPVPLTNRHAAVTPTKDLTDGQTVTVSWSGFIPGKVVNIVECSPSAAKTGDACDLEHGKILTPDPTGEGTVELPIVAGPVGTGVCDATHAGCVVYVNDASLLDPHATLKFPITFAP